MPWSHTSPMDQNTPFIAAELRDRLAVTEGCEFYGVSRKTGYTWIDRYLTHGVPFATNTRARLSQLSAWWVRLGILPACIAPGTPQQNGRHERLHRTLKADTTRPPGANLRAQQRKFNHFREEFNQERPHQALDRRTPAPCSEPSPRERPHKRPPLAYPARFEGRYVSANGGIRGNRHWGNVSITCAGEYVGLEAIDAGAWPVSFGPLTLGRLLARYLRIEGAYGRLTRHR